MSSLFLDCESNSPNNSEVNSDDELFGEGEGRGDGEIDQSKISPMRGRSVKEYDEQLTALKKENFNLKLRIYFLEERMGSTFRIEDKESIFRKNIEYQVDIETLRKDLDEKQDLLCQAVKALELEDSEHKRLLSLKDAQLQHFNEKVETLERDLADARFANATLATNNEKLTSDSNNLVEDALAFQRDHEQAHGEIERLRKELNELTCELTDEKQHNSLLEHDSRELECLQLRCASMETELEEKTNRIDQLVTELEAKGHMVSSCNLRIRTLEDALVSSNSDIKFREKECVARDRMIQEQNLEIDNMRRAIEEAQSICDKEQRQVENLRAAVVARDNSIADLEAKYEKSKTVTRNWEAKVDSLTHENNRIRYELSALKQRRVRTADYSVDRLSPRNASTNSPRMLSPHQISLSSNSTENIIDSPINMQQDEQTKFEIEHKKACRVIKVLIESKQELESENETLKAELEAKSAELRNHQERKSSGRNNTNSHENSMDDSDVNKNFEGVSECDMTTLEWTKQVEDLMCVIEVKEEELKSYKNQLETSCVILQQKDNRITELEAEVCLLKSELNEVTKKLDELETEKPEKEKNVSWIRVTEEKDKKIEQLESEVRKKTFNLQGIVNKELWDKNREIEKQQNRFTDKIKVKEQVITGLEKQLSSKDMQLKMLKEKISELGIQVNLPFVSGDSNTSQELILREQLKVSMEECKYLYKTVEELKQQLKNTPERDVSDYKFVQLKEENVELKKEFEKSEKMRNETVNLCAILTNRLEELAYFLDSLLKHKSVLGVLGLKQRSAIKQAIDQSLDLSKSLSMSMMNDDQSLAQLSSITGLLNNSSANNSSMLFDLFADNNDASLTYNHLTKQRGDGLHNNNDEIISILRAQIETMKKEIEIRDTEIAKHNQPEILKNDDDLVEAIIDLTSPALKTEVLSPGKIYQSLVSNKSCPALLINQLPDRNCSESEAWSEPDIGVSKARMGLDIEAVNKSTSSRSNNNDGTSESTEDEYIVSNNKKRRNSIDILDNKLKEKENEILTLKSDILILSNKSLELKLHMSEEVAKLRNEKLDLEKLLKETVESTELNKKIVELETIIEEKEIYLQNKLHQSDEEYKAQLDTLEKEKLELKIKYENDWIPKSEMFKQVTEMESMYHELDSIKELLKTSEDKIYLLEKSETDLKKRLSELDDSHREKIISLKRELNESTLRASQAALERTKVSNEKLKLEAEIRKLEMKECGKNNELEEKDKELNNLKNNLQKQIAQMEQQKSSLQLKVSELETANAELQNKLIKLQSWSVSTGNPPKISDLVTNFKIFGKHSLAPMPRLSNYIRQRSDISGYTSEDVLTDDNEPNNVFNHSAPSAFHWGVDQGENQDARVVTNSSPDLGIESDQGRFSSLETNITTTVQRPLLQTLELTASMNNLLAATQLDNVGHYCNISAHKNLEKENGELKKNVSKLESGLEKTMHELSKINRTKMQVEKAVCKQIHKTSKVLRQARANLDSGSDGEKRK